MKRRMMLFAVCAALFIPSSCADRHAAVPPETTEAAVTETERDTATETQTTETPSVRTLPGMIMSDVHVQLRGGSVAPGLRADDAETVKRIIGQQTWGMSYDNLSDVWIEAECVRYAYDTSSGILTDADDHAAKLDDAQRETLNAVLASYLSETDAQP